MGRAVEWQSISRKVAGSSPAHGVPPPCECRTGGTHKEGVFLLLLPCVRFGSWCVGYCVEGLAVFDRWYSHDLSLLGLWSSWVWFPYLVG
jgi:hypothetical protein